MRTYLTLFSFTPDAWPDWLEGAQDREDGVRRVIESRGGEMLAFHWTLGEYDGLAIYSVPGVTAAAAVSAGISAAGGIAQLCTTALLDSPEIVATADAASLTSGGSGHANGGGVANGRGWRETDPSPASAGGGRPH